MIESFNPSAIPGSPGQSTSRDTGKRISVMCTDDVDHIYVTSDGATPSAENSEDWLTQTIISSYEPGTVFKAVAVKEGMEDSNIVTYILEEEVGVFLLSVIDDPDPQENLE